LKYVDPSGHEVLFYDNDKNLITLTQAWELFLEVCPDKAKAMMKDTTQYVIATNCIEEGNIHKQNTQLLGADSRNKFQLMLIGENTLSGGVSSVAGTYAHEYEHIEEGHGGSTRQEDYHASQNRYGLLTSNTVLDRYGPPDMTLEVNDSISRLPCSYEVWWPGTYYEYFKETLSKSTINRYQQDYLTLAYKYSGDLSLLYNYGNTYTYVGAPSEVVPDLNYYMMITLMGY
jgi:hypothetical protein